MNAMIDHEELERVKKLEDVEWLKSKKVYRVEPYVDVDLEEFGIIVYYTEGRKAIAESFYSKESSHDCKLKAMDFLEGKSK